MMGLVRSLYIACLGLVVWLLGFDYEHGCPNGASLLRTVKVYSVWAVVVFAMSFVVSWVLFFYSLRGSIVDVDQRKRVIPVLKVLIGIALFEGLLNILGTVFAFRTIPSCDEATWADQRNVSISFYLLRVIVLVSWVHFLSFFAVGRMTISNMRVSRFSDYMNLDIEEQMHIEHATDDEGMSWSVTRSDWERRCKGCCWWFQIITCNIFGGAAHQASDETYSQVANVMARFFKGMDVVPSDLAAALCLLRAEQRSLENAAVQAIIRSRLHPSLHSAASADSADDAVNRLCPTSPFTSSTSFSSWLWSAKNIGMRAQTKLRVRHFQDSHLALDEDTKQLLIDADHFNPYMLGIYGKLLFTYMNLLTGPCLLLCPCLKSKKKANKNVDMLRRMQRAPTEPDNVLEDDCCSLNYSAMRVHGAERNDPKIVFVSFVNKPDWVPYSISIDEETQTVVLAVRGTLSASDMLIDAIVTPKTLGPYAKKWNFEHLAGENNYAHGGFLAAADNLRIDIEQRQILHCLFNPSHEDPMHQARNTEHYGSFQHDLSCLPDCRGYNLKVLGHSLGSGVASILSLMLKPVFPNLTTLAYSPPGCVFDLDLAERSGEWINSVFVGSDLIPRGSWQSLIKLRGQMLDMLRRSKVNKTQALRSAVTNTHADDLLYPEDCVPNTFARQQLLLRINSLQTQTEGMDNLCAVPMYTPGKILHIMRTDTIQEPCCQTTDRFLPVWITDRTCLDEFIVSRRMFLDHFPDFVATVVSRMKTEFVDAEKAYN